MLKKILTNIIQNTTKKHITLGLFIFLFVSVGCYTFYRIKDVAFGVKIHISSLVDGDAAKGAKDGRITIAGTARHATLLTINDFPVSVDQQGNFSEAFLLLPGYNVVTVKAQDKFGKSDSKTYHMAYKEVSTGAETAQRQPDGADKEKLQ